jgi:hypothetical protein
VALDPKYAEAFVNVPHKVLGFKLRPFSLWHKFLLEFYENPLITGGEAVPKDVLEAIQVCRATYPNPPKRETIWTKIRILISSWDQEEEAKRFTNYVEDYLAFPEFWDKEDEGAKSGGGAPDTLTMAVQLMELGFSEEDTWNMALGKMYWYGAATALLKGADLDFVTEEELEMQRNKDQIMADMAEAEKKMKAAMAAEGKNNAEGV